MILVLSYNKYEQGTDPVIDWLLYYQADFVKITIQDLLDNQGQFKIDINNGRLYYYDKDITDEIKVIWYRRFEDDIDLKIHHNTKHIEQLHFEIQNEINTLISYLKRIFAHKKWMPSNDSFSLDKVDITYLAEKNNIKTPKTIVTNNKTDVYNFVNEYNLNSVIIKPIRHSGYFIDKDETYSIYTKKLCINDIDQLPIKFASTLFQECIESDYEIRSFYLDGRFYSTAIICTNKAKDIDIKLSFESSKINWVPYNLPHYFENNIKSFFNKINLNTGSIDILRGLDGEYYFLEVNQVGQYSAPSYRCNYLLEEKIAKWLIQNDK